ncbi:MAG: hypothetical protein J5951_06210 [Bacteroidales bacterium]|nr:hypothetical protein [Bacteroidales bacterium]
MDKFDILIHKGLAWVWLALLIGSLAGVVFAGAYWHLFTAGVSWIMWRCLRDCVKEAERDADITK